MERNLNIMGLKFEWTELSFHYTENPNLKRRYFQWALIVTRLFPLLLSLCTQNGIGGQSCINSHTEQEQLC